MKKFISLLLAVLFCLALTACDVSVDSVEDDTEKTEQQKTETQTGYVDVDLEAEQEVIDLLGRYMASRSLFSSSKHDFGEARLLFGMLEAPFSIDYTNYPVTEPRELSSNESQSVLDRLGYSFEATATGTLVELDKKSVYWIANNIFNLSNDDVDDMINECIDWDGDKELDYNEIVVDGDKYYLNKGDYGGGGMHVDITSVRQNGDKTFVKYDACSYPDWESTFGELQEYDFGIENLRTSYAEMERKEIDGKKYWTLYEISGEIPDGIFETEENSIPSDFAGDYIDTNGYAGVCFDDNGKCTANYHRFIGGEYDAYAECDCSVEFTDINKADKYLYTAKIEKIEYKNEIGTTGKAEK